MAIWTESRPGNDPSGIGALCSRLAGKPWRVGPRMAHDALMQVDGIDGELITLREWSVMDTGSVLAGHNVTRGQVAPLL